MVIKESDLAFCVQMAEQLAKLPDEAQTFKVECLELKARGEKIVELLRIATQKCGDLYERAALRIIDDTEQVLEKALQLVEKCCGNGLMKRMFTIIPANAFRKTMTQLDNSVTNVRWLIQVSTTIDDIGGGMPPIASNEPMLCIIWEHVATLLAKSSMENRTGAATGLVSLAQDNKRNTKLIIEEGGVPPLLKLLKEGDVVGQEGAARAINELAKEPEDVEQILSAGVCTVFAKILKEGDMKVQSLVALAIANFADIHPKCQDHFAQNNCIRLLVRHLAFETIQEHSKYTVNTKQNMSSIHSLVMAQSDHHNNTNMHNNEDGYIHHNDGDQHHDLAAPRPLESQSSSSQMHSVITNTMAAKQQVHGKHIIAGAASLKGREAVDPAIKAEMKANAAEALGKLSVGNVGVCKSITESRALLCFAALLEEGQDENIRVNSAFAIMEITAVAEGNSELRHSAFKPNTPAARALLDQFVRILENREPDLLLPCIKSIGHLARTFRATETRFIPRLVPFLDEEVTASTEIKKEVIIALTKFACTDNFLHQTHCTSIIEAGGDEHLIQLISFGEEKLRIPALNLLCYVVMHFPQAEQLAQNKALPTFLDSCEAKQDLSQDSTTYDLLIEAKTRMNIYKECATET